MNCFVDLYNVGRMLPLTANVDFLPLLNLVVSVLHSYRTSKVYTTNAFHVASYSFEKAYFSFTSWFQCVFNVGSIIVYSGESGLQALAQGSCVGRERGLRSQCELVL